MKTEKNGTMLELNRDIDEVLRRIGIEDGFFKSKRSGQPGRRELRQCIIYACFQTGKYPMKLLRSTKIGRCRVSSAVKSVSGWLRAEDKYGWSNIARQCLDILGNT